MTLIHEYHDKPNECSCCGKQLKAGDGAITYNHGDLDLALGSCCAFKVLSSLLQDAENALKSNMGEIWVRNISGENGDKLRRVAKAANELADHLQSWSEVESRSNC